MAGLEYYEDATAAALMTKVSKTNPLPTAPAIAPTGTTQFIAGSGNVANAAAVATVGSGANFAYLTGFDLTGGGATAAGIIQVTVSGLAVSGGTLVWTVMVPAGATGGITPLMPRFNPPLKSAAATNIIVTAAAFGVGNTNATLNVYGFSA